MENLSGYTETELLKTINDSVAEHERLKKEIFDLTFEVDKLEKKINEKLAVLDSHEKNYVILIEELNSRQNVIR
jgi:hypothetical protein